jgi:hypothetical protein
VHHAPAATRDGAQAGPGAILTIARTALVVFEDRPDAGALRWLRPGFRHCFCLTGDDRRWVLLDPLKGGLAVALVEGLSADALAVQLARGGRRILHGNVIEPGASVRPALRPLTCVEVVKRAVGLASATVVTPHQLYRRLLRPGPGCPAYVELGPRGAPRETG